MAHHPGATSGPPPDDFSPVVIIGAGPVGLTASLLLSRFKVPHLLVEQLQNPPEHPQAHFITTRSMEIFREMDGAEQKIRAASAPLEEWRRYIYCTRIDGLSGSDDGNNGSLLGVRDHFPDGPDYAVSPTWECNLPQSRLQRLLRKAASRSGYCRLLEGFRAAVREDDDDGATVIFEDVSTGRSEAVRCRYAVCADGAHSDSRRQLGIAQRNQTDVLQHLINVHFYSDALARMMRETLTGMLYFVYSSDGIGVFVNHGLERGEFVLQLPYFPAHRRSEDFTRQQCTEVIHALVGRPIAVDVRSIRPWRLRAGNADRYRSAGGRCFLVGDAAHQMLPAGGFGMNSGIADAHNLMWKIALALKHRGEDRRETAEALLASYETERRPVAQRCIDMSVQNYNLSMAVPAAIGLDPQAAKIMDTALRWMPIPAFVRRRIFGTALRIGLSQVKLLNRDNLVGRIRRNDLEKIFADPSNTLALRFPDQDLGTVYQNGWLHSDADTGGLTRGFHSRLRVGGRMPHFEVIDRQSEGGPYSSLDLPAKAVAEDGTPGYLLLSFEPPGSGEARLAEELSQKFHPLRILHLGENSAERSLDIRISGPRPDFLPHSGAVLLRPDGHVALRTEFC